MFSMCSVKGLKLSFNCATPMLYNDKINYLVTLYIVFTAFSVPEGSKKSINVGLRSQSAELQLYHLHHGINNQILKHCRT